MYSNIFSFTCIDTYVSPSMIPTSIKSYSLYITLSLEIKHIRDHDKVEHLKRIKRWVKHRCIVKDSKSDESSRHSSLRLLHYMTETLCAIVINHAFLSPDICIRIVWVNEWRRLIGARNHLGVGADGTVGGFGQAAVPVRQLVSKCLYIYHIFYLFCFWYLFLLSFHRRHLDRDVWNFEGSECTIIRTFVSPSHKYLIFKLFLEKESNQIFRKSLLWDIQAIYKLYYIFRWDN